VDDGFAEAVVARDVFRGNGGGFGSWDHRVTTYDTPQPRDGFRQNERWSWVVAKMRNLTPRGVGKRAHYKGNKSVFCGCFDSIGVRGMQKSWEFG
jgi:hypothetical protein